MAIQTGSLLERPHSGQLVGESGSCSVIRGLRLLVAVMGFARVATAGTVWSDTDVSIGSPIREDDDAYEIVFALPSPEIRIAGDSTSYGIAQLGDTTRAPRELLRPFGD